MCHAYQRRPQQPVAQLVSRPNLLGHMLVGQIVPLHRAQCFVQPWIELLAHRRQPYSLAAGAESPASASQSAPRPCAIAPPCCRVSAPTQSYPAPAETAPPHCRLRIRETPPAPVRRVCARFQTRPAAAPAGPATGPAQSSTYQILHGSPAPRGSPTPRHPPSNSTRPLPRRLRWAIHPRVPLRSTPYLALAYLLRFLRNIKIPYFHSNDKFRRLASRRFIRIEDNSSRFYWMQHHPVGIPPPAKPLFSGDLQESLRKPRHVAHGLDHLLVLNPRRRNHRHRPKVGAAQPRLRANQHQVLHRRGSLVQSHHHAHLLLFSVHICGQQFHQPLLGLQRQSASVAAAHDPTHAEIRFAMPSTKIAGPLRRPPAPPCGKAPPLRSASRDRPRAPLHAPRHLCANALNRPPAEVLVQIARCRLQLNMRQLRSRLSTRSCTAPACVTSTASTRPAESREK
jgi:hypothetical protein